MCEIGSSGSIKVFISYAHKDETLWKELDEQLGALKHESIIEVWSDHKIMPGTEWNEDIQRELEAADLILLLVSSAFLNSPYCYGEEMRRAVERHKAGAARVVPIALRSCDWEPTPFAKLQGLPRGMKPIGEVPKHQRDAVWAEVAKGIRQAAQACAARRTASSHAESKVEGGRLVLPIFHVPLARNQFFTGREDTLEAVRRVLGAGGIAVVSQVAAITGLGGIGKTQTALEYAYRHREDYRVIWWMEADSAASLDRGIAELAAELRLPGADPADPARTRATLCRWMERESGWLLILDNADQPQTLRGYLPPAPAGHLLITSRSPLFRKMAKVLDLDPWPREQSIEFLLRRTDCNDKDDAAALAAELGDLPLALEQAAAYVEATGQGFAGYLALYRQRFAELAGADEFRPQEYPNTVLTTWTVSLAAAERESPIAGDLLRLLAFLAPEDISRDLLTGHGAELPHSLAEAIADGLAFDHAVAALRRYSLIKATAAGFAVHRLVQAVTRARLPDPLPWANAAITLINATFPEKSDDPDFWLDCGRMRPHAEAALAAAQGVTTEVCHTRRLLDRLVVYLLIQGHYRAADPLAHRALAIAETAFGSNSPELATSLNSLSLLYRAQGRYGKAELLCQRALAIREKVLGPEHPDVAASLHNLSLLYRAQGRYGKAELLCQRALAIREKVLGPEHPDVAASLHNLANLHHIEGRHGQVAPLYQRALAIREKVLGPEHPDVAASLHNLALLYHAQGRSAEAEPLSQRALNILEETLGPEHPDIACSLTDLANLYRAQGRYSEAELLFQRALAIREKALGPEHPHVAESLNNLARLYADQGRFAKAEPLYQRALAITEKVLGPDHLDVITIRSSLPASQLRRPKLPRTAARSLSLMS